MKYIRDNKNHKVGSIIAFVDDSQVKIGFSKCNTNYDEVDRNRLVDLSVIRARDYSHILPQKYNIPFKVIDELPNFINRCRQYYKDKQLPEWAKFFNPDTYRKELNHRLAKKHADIVIKKHNKKIRKLLKRSSE